MLEDRLVVVPTEVVLSVKMVLNLEAVVVKKKFFEADREELVSAKLDILLIGTDVVAEVIVCVICGVVLV